MEDGEGTLERPAAPKIVFDDGEKQLVNFTFGGGGGRWGTLLFSV